MLVSIFLQIKDPHQYISPENSLQRRNVLKLKTAPLKILMAQLSSYNLSLGTLVSQSSQHTVLKLCDLLICIILFYKNTFYQYLLFTIFCLKLIRKFRLEIF